MLLSGNFFIEHEWAHMSFNFEHDNGAKTMPLAQAKVEDEAHYRMAVKVIKERLFSR